MKRAVRTTIFDVLEMQTDMTIATVRSDGYPQATTVSYVNDGMKIYFACARDSQKARNIAKNNKVSLTVNAPYADWNEIKALSIGGTAEQVTDKDELNRVRRLVFEKFPPIAGYEAEADGDIAVFRVTPQVICVLGYTKGFGHRDLVAL